VATGAPCDHCLPDDPARGAVLSFTLEGDDRQIVARGLRHPAGLAFAAGALWTVDTARDALFDTPDLDELNQVTPGAHFGWPFCLGAANTPDWPGGAFDCADAAPPALTFPTHSQPQALAAYRGDALPSLQGALLVALGGSRGRVDLRGNAVAAVYFDAGSAPSGYNIILPEEPQTNAARGFTLQEMNYRLSGLYPSRPYGVAVSREGWVYISSGRRIIALRPQASG
jgi:glucose/arabinose dehydrogenase